MEQNILNGSYFVLNGKKCQISIRNWQIDPSWQISSFACTASS